MIPSIIPVIDEMWGSKADACPVRRAWDRSVHLRPLHPTSTVLQPDQAMGFAAQSLKEFFPRFWAREEKKRREEGMTCRMGEVCKGLAWPYFTIETERFHLEDDKDDYDDDDDDGGEGEDDEGEQLRSHLSPMDAITLQNMHNSAVMVENLLRLKQAVDQECVGFLDVIQALTMDISSTAVSLSCHWATKDGGGPGGKISYRSALVYRQRFDDGSGNEIQKIRQAATNALEWIRERSWGRVHANLTVLEERLRGEERRASIGRY